MGRITKTGARRVINDGTPYIRYGSRRNGRRGLLNIHLPDDHIWNSPTRGKLGKSFFFSFHYE
jgi:hypothetical protein